jgi:hypothetical protein
MSTIWDGGKVYTDALTPEYTDPVTVSPQVYTDPLTEVYTDRSPFQRKKEKDTESHDSAPGGTLRERYERKYQEASNKPAVIGELFSEALGREPNYKRLGAMTKGLGSGGKMIDLIIEASRFHITDDPHDYLAGMIKRQQARPAGGYKTQADHNSAGRGRLVT